MNTTFKYLYKNGITGTSRIIISSLFTLTILPLLISKIGLINYGILALTNTFTGLTGLFDLGLSKSLVYRINKNKDQNQINNYISAGFFINLTIVLIIVISSILVAVLKINVFGSILDEKSQYFEQIIFISILVLSLNLYNTFQASLLESYLMLHFVNIGFIINIISLNGLYLLNILTINSFSLLLFTPVISYVFASIYYFIIIKIKLTIKIVRPNRTYISEMFKTTFSFLKIGLLSSLHLPINRLLLTYHSASPQYIAIFDISLKLVLFINNILSNLSNPLLGIISNNKTEGKKSINFIISISAVIVVLSFMFYILLNKYIIQFFFKVNNHLFNEINTVIIILFFGLGIVGIFEAINKFMMGIGEFNKLFKIRIFIIILNLSAFTILSLSNTLYNVVLSYSISLVLFAILLVYHFYIRKNK